MHGKYTQITNVERHQIKVLLDSGFSFIDIAHKLNRAVSSITREVHRNIPKRGRGYGIYNPERAQIKTELRHASKPKQLKLTVQIQQDIVKGIIDDWSPEQIVGRAAKEGKTMVSHETIYKFVYENRRNGGQLYSHLRRRHRRRRKRTNVYNNRGIIANRTFIDYRPNGANNKSRIGHFEGDTMIGKNHIGAIVSLTEMKTKYQFLVKVQDKAADAVQKAIEMKFGKNLEWVKTLTVDNGKEFACHQTLEQNLSPLKVFFCHPYAPYERGLNENHNGLVRQYIPKKTSFINITDHDIAYVEDRLNNRPRKSLGFLSPKEALTKYLCKRNFALIT